jgi:Zn-dependent protease with chaperone function
VAVVDIDVRWLVQLVLLSLLLTLTAAAAFRANAHSRRAFGLLAIVILVLAPAVLVLSPTWSWPFWVEDAGRWNQLWRHPIPSGLLLLWLLGALWQIASVLVRFHRGRALLDAAPATTDPRLQRHLESVAGALRLPRIPTLRLGNDVGPCCSVWGRPVILLPRTALYWDEDSVRAVLAHEAVHLKRRDGIQLLIVDLVRAVYWWLPWLWTLQLAHARAIEETCDDRAASLCESGEVYAASVGRLARRLSPVEGSQEGLPQMAAHALVVRIQRFLGVRIQELHVASVYWFTILVLLLGFVGTSVEFAERPQVASEIRTSTPIVVIDAAESLMHRPRRPAVDLLIETAPGDVVGPAFMRNPFPKPMYPAAGLNSHIETDVLVQVDVAAGGLIQRIEVINEAPAAFTAAVYRAFEQAGARPSVSLASGRYQLRYRFRFTAVDAITPSADRPSAFTPEGDPP